MLQGHVILWLETNAGTEDVRQCTALLSQSVNNRRSRRSHGSFKHVAENAEDTVEVLEVLGSSTVVGVSFPLDTGHHFRNKHKVNDQW